MVLLKMPLSSAISDDTIGVDLKTGITAAMSSEALLSLEDSSVTHISADAVMSCRDGVRHLLSTPIGHVSSVGGLWQYISSLFSFGQLVYKRRYCSRVYISSMTSSSQF
jgi:hypothetical protein